VMMATRRWSFLQKAWFCVSMVTLGQNSHGPERKLTRMELTHNGLLNQLPADLDEFDVRDSASGEGVRQTAQRVIDIHPTPRRVVRIEARKQWHKQPKSEAAGDQHDAKEKAPMKWYKQSESGTAKMDRIAAESESKMQRQKQPASQAIHVDQLEADNEAPLAGFAQWPSLPSVPKFERPSRSKSNVVAFCVMPQWSGHDQMCLEAGHELTTPESVHSHPGTLSPASLRVMPGHACTVVCPVGKWWQEPSVAQLRCDHFGAWSPQGVVDCKMRASIKALMMVLALACLGIVFYYLNIVKPAQDKIERDKRNREARNREAVNMAVVAVPPRPISAEAMTSVDSSDSAAIASSSGVANHLGQGIIDVPQQAATPFVEFVHAETAQHGEILSSSQISAADPRSRQVHDLQEQSSGS